MQVHTAELTISQDGKVVLHDLPFHRGQKVKILIEEVAALDDATRYPLWGSPITYIDPLEPACPPEEWEANR